MMTLFFRTLFAIINYLINIIFLINKKGFSAQTDKMLKVGHYTAAMSDMMGKFLHINCFLTNKYTVFFLQNNALKIN